MRSLDTTQGVMGSNWRDMSRTRCDVTYVSEGFLRLLRLGADRGRQEGKQKDKFSAFVNYVGKR